MAAKKKTRNAGVFGAQARSVELLWGTSERSGRGPKPALTLRGVVRAGIEIADREGLAAVSMQRVASALGVTPMALYRYVPGKAELVDLMVDAAIAPPPEAEGNWRAQMEAWAHALFAQFERHPWALEATRRLRHMGPNELAWLESGLAILAETGLRGAELVDAFLTVNAHVRGFAQFAVRAPDRPVSVGLDEWSAGLKTLLGSHAASYPAISAAIAAGGFEPGTEGEEAFGLARVLDGIAAYVAKQKRS
jgi:AcrR family transcriptional regulator